MLVAHFPRAGLTTELRHAGVIFRPPVAGSPVSLSNSSLLSNFSAEKNKIVKHIEF
jgi:hypothetical protein